MADDSVNIEINGEKVQARKGEMIIQATDRHNVYVPRFCYHDKLSIAANCRMCLVEVEKAPKPLPACATPVTEGMKIFTRSEKAIGAQRATMEFLLINHPLDCPICDQGGECELQDLAVGFGRDLSRYSERKRVVADENLGPLIATDMTRCIHCTRCVRFTQEIAGRQELGMVGRGENMKVRTAIEATVNHELSGNVIDLCPVGALVSKPYRFSARAWEMISHPLISPHDGVGTNLFGHVLRGQLKRVVPRENEAINETWIADRDRFSYEAVYSPQRLERPLVRDRRSNVWKETDWETALQAAADGLAMRASTLGVLGSPSATLEELYLLGKLARALSTRNIDTRVRQRDVRDDAGDPLYPNLGMAVQAVDRLDALLVVGSNLRHELPILAHRVRKAAIRRDGARVAFINPAVFAYEFPISTYLESGPGRMPADLAAVLAAALQASGKTPPDNVAGAVRLAKVEESHRAIAAALTAGEQRAVWLGALALRHPSFADLRALAAALCQVTGATLGVLAEGANAAGSYLAGAVPHREPGGKPGPEGGLSATEMLRRALPAYLLFGGLEPWADAPDIDAHRTLAESEFVVSVTPFVSDELKDLADVILPIGTFAETSGTYVNLEGRWQTQTGAALPVGESRPGWKVLRVLGNHLHLPGFEQQSSEEVLAELRALTGGEPAMEPYHGLHKAALPTTGASLTDVPMYQIDAVVRRAPSLGRTLEGRVAAATY